MTRSRILTALFALFILVAFVQPAAAHYDPKLGRWLERDPLGTPIPSADAVRIGQQYRDGMNLYGYARHSPATRFDPMGLSSCMDECVAGCPRSYILPGITTLPPEIPKKYVRTNDHGEFFGEIDEYPSLSCYRRCRTMCSCPDGTCTPKGQVVWGTPNTTAGTSGFSLSVSVVGEDPSCCSEFGIVQFVRSITGGGEEYGPWRIDDGRVGGLSDRSPVQPYFQEPATIRNPGGRGLLVFGDKPGSFYNVLWDFRIVVMCTAGPAAGHIYGMYTWSVGTGVGGVWHGPSSAPIVPSAISNELPPILQDRECCDRQGASP